MYISINYGRLIIYMYIYDNVEIIKKKYLLYVYN